MKERNIDKKISSIEDLIKLTSEEKIHLISSKYTVPGKMSSEEAFSELAQKIKAETRFGPADRTFRDRYIYWGIAAAVLLLIGVSVILMKKNTVSVLASKGTQIEYTLPDSSMVLLNAGSEISFSRSDFTGNRYLQLKGEAFFSTKKGSGFIVSTQYGQVKTLGTSFNVNSRDKYFKVSCLTGKILVSVPLDSLIIMERESAILKGTNLIRNLEENIEKNAAWRFGEFHFEDMPLISVFNEIERQFDVTVEAPGAENRFFTGSFYNKDLREALDIVCIPMELKYDFRNKRKIIISDASR